MTMDQNGTYWVCNASMMGEVQIDAAQKYKVGLAITANGQCWRFDIQLKPPYNAPEDGFSVAMDVLEWLQDYEQNRRGCRDTHGHRIDEAREVVSWYAQAHGLVNVATAVTISSGLPAGFDAIAATSAGVTVRLRSKTQDLEPEEAAALKKATEEMGAIIGHIGIGALDIRNGRVGSLQIEVPLRAPRSPAELVKSRSELILWLDRPENRCLDLLHLDLEVASQAAGASPVAAPPR
ncbi:hypothetical protein [Caenispirillum salinarum]|uniref:hypothetical protein n=1 Tax=Caenispirillum salinarum TaxID=859058 RepID=UPI00385173FD